MKVNELRYRVERSGHEPFFFNRDTMRFFGDRMSNYGVRSAVILTDWKDDEYQPDAPVEIEVWELYRKRPVKHGNKDSAYFDKRTFKRIFPHGGE